MSKPSASNSSRQGGTENHSRGRKPAMAATTKPTANHPQLRGTRTSGGRSIIKPPAPVHRRPCNTCGGNSGKATATRTNSRNPQKTTHDRRSAGDAGTDGGAN